MPLFRTIPLFLFLSFIVACGGGDGDGGGGGDAGGGGDQVDETIGGGGDPVADGDFLLFISDAVNEDWEEVMDLTFQPRLGFVNGIVDMPEDLPVSVQNCGISNAFYIPGEPAIVMCWELFFDILTYFDTVFEDDLELSFSISLGAYIHVLHHEMGHAFDDQLELPIVGNTESAADAIATVLDVEQGLGIYAIAAALLFDSSGDGSFGAVHPGGADRAGDLFCWALGGDPQLAESFSDFVQIFIDAGRDCVTEYAGQRSAVVSWLPGLDSASGLASNPDRSISSAGTLSDSSMDALADALRNSNTVQNLGG